MNMPRKTILAACAFLSSGSYSVAAQGTSPLEQRSFLELARVSCAAQVDALSAVDTHTIDVLEAQTGGLDPNVPPNYHAVFDKFSVGTLMNAIQIGDITSYVAALNSDAPVSPEKHEKSSVTLDLVECLWITPEDRIVLGEFVEWGIESGNIPKEATVDDILYAINYSECIRHIEASRRILAIELDSSDAPNQVQAIYEDTIGSCEEAYK